MYKQVNKFMKYAALCVDSDGGGFTCVTQV